METQKEREQKRQSDRKFSDLIEDLHQTNMKISEHPMDPEYNQWQDHRKLLKDEIDKRMLPR